jgi:hypothetical protein
MYSDTRRCKGSVQEVRGEVSLLHGLRLLLWGLGTVRGASALAFAVVLASVLFVAASLSLAIVLTLTGVLGQLLLIGSYAGS